MHLIVVLSILLVYMIMAALFESLLHPFVILLAIPFAAVGGILMLWLTGTNVSMPMWIGGIMLVGGGQQRHHHGRLHRPVAAARQLPIHRG